MRYASQKRRATTQKTYAMDICYSKVVTDGKRLHRTDGIFYIVKVKEYFSSVSKFDFERYYKDEKNIECWEFKENRWRKSGHCK